MYSDITQEELKRIYNVTKKRLTIGENDFINNIKYENIRNKTIKRYNSLIKLLDSIKNTKKYNIFLDNVSVEYGKNNNTLEYMYLYFVDRIKEVKDMYNEVDVDYLYSYCLLNRSSRQYEIKMCEMKKRSIKKSKVEALYDYLLKDTDIIKTRFINLEDDYYEDERNVIMTIDSNLDNMKEAVFKLNDEDKYKFLTAVKTKYHLNDANGYYVCRYLFDNFRMIKVLKNIGGYNRLKSNSFLDIFKCSMNVDNITSAYNYLNKKDGYLIKEAYLELKDNDVFKNMVKVDNNGISISIINKIGSYLDIINVLNDNLSFIRKVTISKYITSNDNFKKNLLKEALFNFKRKVIKGTKDSALNIIKNFTYFELLREEDKELLLNNYKNTIDEVFDLCINMVEYVDIYSIDEIIKYISGKYILICMIRVQDDANINKIDFIINNSNDDKYYIDNYNLFIAKKMRNDYVNEYNEETHEMINEKTSDVLINTIDNRKVDTNLDEIFDRYNKLEDDKYATDIKSSEDILLEERIRLFKEKLLFEYKSKYSENSFGFFSAMYDLLKIYEIKMNKLYDPNINLFTFDDFYKFFKMSLDERKNYELNLIITTNVIGEEKKNI